MIVFSLYICRTVAPGLAWLGGPVIESGWRRRIESSLQLSPGSAAIRPLSPIALAGVPTCTGLEGIARTGGSCTSAWMSRIPSRRPNSRQTERNTPPPCRVCSGGSGIPSSDSRWTGRTTTGNSANRSAQPKQVTSTRSTRVPSTSWRRMLIRTFSGNSIAHIWGRSVAGTADCPPLFRWGAGGWQRGRSDRMACPPAPCSPLPNQGSAELRQLLADFVVRVIEGSDRF